MRAGLEEELHAELHGPGIARRADSSVHSTGDVCTRKRREVCVIENIEDLPAKLKALRFTKVNIFCQSSVPTRCRRTVDCVSAGVADAINACRWIRKASSIEPLQVS